MDDCTYTVGKWVENRYPRREYTTSCGLLFVNLYEEVWNGKKHTHNPPNGKCMKCGKQIIIGGDIEIIKEDM